MTNLKYPLKYILILQRENWDQYVKDIIKHIKEIQIYKQPKNIIQQRGVYLLKKYLLDTSILIRQLPHPIEGGACKSSS